MDPKDCPNPMSCQWCLGKDELIYHPLIFKTKMCDGCLDDKGYCSKYGRHCAKAHSEDDLRKPIRAQNMPNNQFKNLHANVKDHLTAGGDFNKHD
jgi:hypothetical protein